MIHLFGKVSCGLETLFHGLIFKLGDGSTINMWSDSWTPVLKHNILPLPAQPVTHPISSIIDFCHWNEGWKWDNIKVESIWGPNIAKFIYSLQPPNPLLH